MLILTFVFRSKRFEGKKEKNECGNSKQHAIDCEMKEKSNEVF